MTQLSRGLLLNFVLVWLAMVYGTTDLSNNTWSSMKHNSILFHQNLGRQGEEIQSKSLHRLYAPRMVETSTLAPVDDDDDIVTISPSVASTIHPTNHPTAVPIPPTSSPTKKRTHFPTTSPTVEDWQEKIKDEEEQVIQIVQNQTAEILAGILAFSGLMGMILTAYMILNYPDGICTSCCQLAIRCIQLIRKLFCLPCDLIRYRGYTSSEAADRSMFLEKAVEHTSDLELV
jgi:hypothetical protein